MYVPLVILMLLFPANLQSHQSETNKKTDHAKNISTPAPTPSPCASVTCQVSQSSAYNAQQQPEQQSKNIWEKAFAPETWSQWGLLLTAAIAAFIYWHTLKGTHKAADAALRSVKLQEVLNRQWVELEKWENRGQSARGSDSPIREDERVIYFGCEILNPTSMPLTVTRFELTALGRDYTAPFKSFLVPRASVPQIIPLVITTREEVDAYKRGQLEFNFTGIITFLDAFSQERKQPFAFRFQGGMGGGQIDVLKEKHPMT